MPVTTEGFARTRTLVCIASLAAGLSAAGCRRGQGGDSGSAVAPAPTSTVLERTQLAPGVVVAIASLHGGSDTNGAFRPGDHITLEYTLRKKDGSPWGVGEMPFARVLVSGPTFNYQRVIAERADVKARSAYRGNGAYTYAFDVPIPSVYLPPYNDSPAFGPFEGELAGEALLDGTYTVGLSFAWDYSVEGQSFRDAGEATADFPVGDTAVFARREVVRQENCDRCHVNLQAHEGRHRNVTLCLLCHTSGAEDAQIPTVFGGTPGESVDARVLFHKLHNGAHLPTVVGIAVAPNGTLDYSATPRRYVVVGEDGAVHDYSNARFPAWPNRSIPMPRSQVYAGLSASAKAKDDAMRTGVTSCAVCHGDPDGVGPLVAPAQGSIAYAQPSRRACAACHDYLKFDVELNLDAGPMPPATEDSMCTRCHGVLGGSIAVDNAHRHPLVDTILEPQAPFEAAFATGLNFEIQGLVEGQGGDGDGTLDPGEAVQVQFTIHNDEGTSIAASTLGAMRAVISGPTSNSQLILDVDVPRARFPGLPPYTSTLPQRVLLELAGHSTLAANESFATALAPHWNIAGAQTVVRVRTGTSGVSSNLTMPAPAMQNFVDVADAGGFLRDDVIVVDDGVTGSEEYLRVQYVDGQRLWFSSPSSPAYVAGLRVAHALGASVSVVQLQGKVVNVDYTLLAQIGSITEVTEFGDNQAVLVDYVTDFRLPGRYPLAANASPDLDESFGKWATKSLVSGTYRLGLSGWFEKTYLNPQRYTIASVPATRDFLVGSAQSIEPYALVDTGAACSTCHQDLWFHEGRQRGFDNCILCHGAAGSEDRPPYVAANAPATTGVTVNFRTLLHTIHRGSQLDHALSFAVVDARTQPYPDNFAVENFAHVQFPAQPGATAQCAKCHGAANEAWKEPRLRDHPTEQGAPTRVWRAVCAACHDTDADTAHSAEHTTSMGIEACGSCHAEGAAYAVELYHMAR